MVKKKRSELLEILNSKLVIIVLVFSMFFLATILAGNVIVKEGSMEIEENLNSSGVLYVNSTTGRVGVGTANPRTEFQVIGDVTFGQDLTNYAWFQQDGSLQHYGTARIVIGDDRHAFIANSYPSAGLYFSNQRANIEFTNFEGEPTLVIGVGSDKRVGIGITDPSCKLEVDGAISSASTTITASSDAFDVGEVNILYVDTSGGAVVIGGLVNGVAGQVLHLVRIDDNNNLTLEHFEGTGTQKLIMHNASDETIDNFGGFTLVCDGTYWFDVS
jgi:ethanolamine utilization microcompartment shell protein EutS